MGFVSNRYEAHLFFSTRDLKICLAKFTKVIMTPLFEKVFFLPRNFYKGYIEKIEIYPRTIRSKRQKRPGAPIFFFFIYS